jgi:hypothetical protein
MTAPANKGPLVLFGHDLSGTTAARPTNAELGQTYYDTDIGAQLVYNGTSWESAGATAGPQIVAYLPLAENVASGTRHDLSGYDNSAADTNTVNTATGQCNPKCANFTAGSTNQLNITDAANLRAGTAHFTIMFLHFATAHNGQTYLTKGTGGDSGVTTPEWTLNAANSGKLDWIVSKADGSGQVVAEVAASNSTLYFVVARINPRTQKIGLSVTALTADTMAAFTETAFTQGVLSTSFPVRISGDGFGSGHFTGTCEELCIIKNYEIPALQLEQLFQDVRLGRPLFH